MSTAFAIGRVCLRNVLRFSRQTGCPAHLRRQIHSTSGRTQPWQKYGQRPKKGPVLLAAAATLTPAAFVKLSEDEEKGGNKEGGEKHMLNASRDELRQRKEVGDEEHGVMKVLHKIILVLDKYIYEPLATGLRFLHLVVIFVPVIITAPVIWIGSKQKNRNDTRTGTLWWYGFLVNSMERAGPAFIKVNSALNHAPSSFIC